jgi:hypothetical protein
MLEKKIMYEIDGFHGYNDKISSSVSKIRLDLNLFQNLHTERSTDHGQATGKLYHLRLPVECTLFYALSDINMFKRRIILFRNVAS